MAVASSEFRITIGHGTGDGYPLLVTAPFVYGEPTGLLRLDLGSEEMRHRLSGIQGGQASDQFFRDFGSFLFERLLPGDLGTSFELNLKEADGSRGDAALRVMLQVLAEDLRGLPWEVLHHPVQGMAMWLCTDRRTPLSRYVGAAVPPPVRVSLPLRILVCLAEPSDLPSAQGRVESAALHGALDKLRAEGRVEFRLVGRARRDALRRALEEFGPHLFHFIGHGVRQDAVSHIALERPDGTADLLSADFLRELLQRPGTVKAAVLNACKSDAIAFALARRGVASVGMQYDFASEAAVCLCRSLYEALAAGAPFDAAVNSARFAVRLECGADRRDWCVPAVFLPGGWAGLFDIEEPAAQAQAPRIQDAGAPPEAGRSPGRPEPGRVDSAPPATGRLKIHAGRPRAHVWLLPLEGHGRRALGATGRTGELGPVDVPAGLYHVRALWEPPGARRGRRLEARATNVVVGRGETVEVALRFPEPPRPWWERFGRLPGAIGTKLASVRKQEWVIFGALALAIGVVGCPEDPARVAVDKQLITLTRATTQALEPLGERGRSLRLLAETLARRTH